MLTQIMTESLLNVSSSMAVEREKMWANDERPVQVLLFDHVTFSS